MGEAYLFGTGGVDNLKSAFANINVEYPAGSTLVCTNAETGKTYKASNTLGSYTFGVNSAGTWDITATRGEDTKTDHVEITEQGQNVNIEIIYQLWLYDNGVQWEGGFSDPFGSGSSYLHFDATRINMSCGWQSTTKAYTKKPVDLSKFTKLHFVVPSAVNFFVGLGTNNSASITLVSYGGAGTYNLDVSAQTNELQVIFWVYSRGNSISSASISQIWLD